MNLSTLIDPRLWSAIQNSYESRNFSSAILDAHLFLGEMLRQKTGLEGDGVALAGQALGGKNPRLRINKMQTESERNTQAGFEQIVRGLFQGIRNPRSHTKHVDLEADADSIILFINFITGEIDRSKTTFSKADFISRVFDQHFVEKERYAKILVRDVPKKERLEIFLDVLRARETGDCKKLRYFVAAMLPKLGKQERAEVYAAISEELRTNRSETALRTMIHIMPDDFLLHCGEDARLRTENQLLESIGAGKKDPNSDRCLAGALGTWARGLSGTFLQKDDLIRRLTRKLHSDDQHEHAYLTEYFWNTLTTLIPEPTQGLARRISDLLKAGNKMIYEAVASEQMWGDSKWGSLFIAEVKTFVEQSTPPQVEDDVPF